MHYDLSLLIQGILGYGVIIMVALGFQLVFSTSHMFHFVYIGIYVFIVYMVYWSERLHLSLWEGVSISAATALILTALMEYLVYRPMRRRGSSPLAILIASLGMLISLQNGLALLFGSQPVILKTPRVLTGKIVLAGFQLSRIEVTQIIVDLLVFSGVYGILRWSRFGIEARSVADDPHRARLLGVDVNRVVLLVLLLSSLMLVPVAVLDGMNTGGNPYAGEDTLLIASIIAFVGGIGSISGTMIVGIVTGVISGVSLLVVPSQWTELVVFSVLLVAILLRPVGIMSSVKGTRAV